MTAGVDRLPRLLALIPYLQARPGIGVVEAAEDLGITEPQLRRDLELLWVCGLPGHGPGDLIDLSFEGDTISVAFDAGMDRPLRLSADEALALVVALRTLAGIPGLGEQEAVASALAKIENSAGGRTAGAELVTVTVESEERWLGGLRRALEDKRAVGLTYYVAGRDESTERVVDPMRLLLVEGRSYLEAWCRQAKGVRLFRLDRIDAIDVLDEPAAVPPEATPREITGGLFQSSPDQSEVTIEVTRSGRWIADFYPCERVVETADGGVQVTLRVGDRRWLQRLLLRLGPDIVTTASDPMVVEVVDEITAEAERALAAYGG